MTHTKGPWRVEGTELLDIGDNALAHAVIRSKEERWTALVEIEDPEGEANARLIAAAPELYEALNGLVSEIDLSKLNVRKDFSLLNAHAYAAKALHRVEEGAQ